MILAEKSAVPLVLSLPLSLSLSLYIYIYIYLFIYIYIYMYAVKLLSGPSLGVFKVIVWAKFVFLKTLFATKHYRNRDFSFKKNVHKNFQSYYLGQVGHVYVPTNLAQIITLTWPR